jgi:hypothetical protein
MSLRMQRAEMGKLGEQLRTTHATVKDLETKLELATTAHDALARERVEKEKEKNFLDSVSNIYMAGDLTWINGGVMDLWRGIAVIAGWYGGFMYVLSMS